MRIAPPAENHVALPLVFTLTLYCSKVNQCLKNFNGDLPLVYQGQFGGFPPHCQCTNAFAANNVIRQQNGPFRRCRGSAGEVWSTIAVLDDVSVAGRRRADYGLRGRLRRSINGRQATTCGSRASQHLPGYVDEPWPRAPADRPTRWWRRRWRHLAPVTWRPGRWRHGCWWPSRLLS